MKPFIKPTVARPGLLWLLLSILTVAGVPGRSALAAEPGDAGAPDQGIRVNLEYQELPYGVQSQNLLLVREAAPFSKEPAAGKSKTVRGRLQFGNIAESRMPFLWDSAHGKLYLDLNRNLDLTDDPAGILSCLGPAFSRRYQTFPGARIEFASPTGNYPALLDLHLFEPESPTAFATVRSFWQGQVQLSGREWQMGIVRIMGGYTPGNSEVEYLLMRPWEDRAQTVSVGEGLDVLPLAVKLFVQDQAYKLECGPELRNGKPAYWVNLTPTPTPLGELRLTGKFLHRVVLQGPYTVVIESPEPAVRLPLGNYRVQQVLLRNGPVEAIRQNSGSISSENQRSISITDASAVSMACGGLLTNSVALRRVGKQLVLDYQLLGADGAPYQVRGQDRTQPPSFSVYRDGQLLYTGNFEFG